nr:immunoglobulin heavy chain junction region [Mus musculus]NSM03901.1 immunoglobulin heavy chain junction region [Mus musculus]NSM03984.1 immunoglobulin heavy chain junction region [Mus musculus]NSM04514.1 immunoglobulin heavy chain junction region [Mus musculus]NSM05019.1 immunoglobulin heavy chain junction region [Mus musculus]
CARKDYYGRYYGMDYW